MPMLKGLRATLAQLVEQLFCKQWVVGSSPTGGSRKGLLEKILFLCSDLTAELIENKAEYMGRYSSGQRGQTVNLLASAFGGSNPSLPTTQICKICGH